MSSATWAPQYLGHIQGTHDRSKAEHVAHGPSKLGGQLDGLVQERCPLLSGARAAQEAEVWICKNKDASLEAEASVGGSRPSPACGGGAHRVRQAPLPGDVWARLGPLRP